MSYYGKVEISIGEVMLKSDIDFPIVLDFPDVTVNIYSKEISIYFGGGENKKITLPVDLAIEDKGAW